jgi:hypothetical protein
MTAAKLASVPADDPVVEPAPEPKKHATGREAEAGDGYVTVEQCGLQLRIPVGGKIPEEALDLFIRGKNREGLLLCIGKAQLKQLRRIPWTSDDMIELDRKVNEARGN